MSGEREFENRMKRLEEIVSLLDGGEVSLEESLKLYREGVECSRFCRQKLANARHEVEVWNMENDVSNAGPGPEDVPF